VRLLFASRGGERLRKLIEAHAAVVAAKFDALPPSGSELVGFDVSTFTRRFDSLVEVMRHEAPEFPDLTLEADVRVAAAFALRTSIFAKETKAARNGANKTGAGIEELNRAGFNVYLDADPQEVAGCATTLGALAKLVEVLNQTYPDNAPLYRITNLLRRLEALPALTTPIMKVLAGLEVLLKECFEWERNAATHVSMLTHIQALSQLIIRWRRLELHSWPHVFAMKRQEFDSKAAVHWFTFFDTCAKMRAGEFNADAFAAFVSDFMWGSNIGQLPARLSMLRAFGQQLLVHDAPSAYDDRAALMCRQSGALLLHLHGYFSHFVPAINEHEKSQTEPLTQELEDFVRIMKWQDANYYAVRASTEKSHLTIARVLSELDEVLCQPIRPIITKSEECITEDTSMGIAAEHSIVAKERKKLESKEKLARKKRRQEQLKQQAAKKAAKDGSAAAAAGKKVAAGKKKQKSVKFAPKDANPQPEADVDDAEDDTDAAAGVFAGSAPRLATFRLRDLASDVVHNVAALQADGIPQARKTRSLKLLLDELDRIGIAHTKETSVGDWSAVFSREVSVRQPLSELDAVKGDTLEDRSDGLIVSWKACQAHFYRMARQLQLLRDASQAPHADLSEGQVNRGVGACESLAAVAVSQLGQCDRMHAVRRALRGLRYAIAHADGTPAADAAAFSRATLSALTAAMQLVGQAKVARSNGIKNCADMNVDVAEDAARAALQLVNEWTAELPPAAVYVTCVQVRDAMKFLEAMEAALATGGPGPLLHTARAEVLPLLHVALEEGRKFVRTAEATEAAEEAKATSKKAPRSKKWSRAVVSALEQWCKAFTLPERLQAAATPADDNEDDAEANGDGHRDDNGVNVPSVVKRGFDELDRSVGSAEAAGLQRLLVRLDTREVDKETAQKITSYLNDVEERVTACTTMVLNLHNATIDAAFVLSRLFQLLCKKGFCKKDDEDEDDGGDGDGGGQGEGTGMDDGQGAKDVTDQLENEDQLMNMKDKEEQKDQNKDEKDDGDEDNAAEVETDFNADKEKASDDEDDGDDDDEENQEVGDVDAADEKDRKKSRDKDRDKDGRDDEGGEAEEVPEDEFSADGSDQDDEEGTDDEDNDGFGNKEDEIRNADKDSDDDAMLDQLADGKQMDSGSGEDEEGDDSDEVQSADSDAESKENDGSGSERDGDDDDDDKNVDENADKDEDDAENPKLDEEQDPGDGKMGDDRELDEESESGETASQQFSDADLKDQNEYDGGQADEQQGTEAAENQDRDRMQPEQDDAGTEERQTGEEQQQDDSGRSWKERQQKDQNARADTTQAQRKSKQQRAKQAAVQERKSARALDIDKAVDRDAKDQQQKNAEDDDQDDGRSNVDEDDEFEFDDKAKAKGLAPTDKDQRDPEEAQGELPEKPDHPDSDDDDTATAQRDEPGKKGAQRRREGDEEVDIEPEDAEALQQKKKRGAHGKMKLQRDDDEAASDSDAEADADDAAASSPLDAMTLARRKWIECEAHVQALSQQLCEQLRLILEPTVADKLQGDYKTGKRINIKKIIPFIASQYKKDKIWLRRTKPNKRSYQVLIAIDDSKSMLHNGADVVSMQAVALITKALQQLDVGEFAVLKFGRTAEVLHGLGAAFGVETGPTVFSRLTFEQPNTHVREFLTTSLDYMDTERVRSMSQVRSTTLQLLQVMFIVTDGHLTEDRNELRKLVARAEANRQVLVLIILDVKAAQQEEVAAREQVLAAERSADLPAPKSKAELLRRRKQERDDRLAKVQSQSVTEMQTVQFIGGKVVKKSYFDEFPFAFYLVVRDLTTLPEVLADAMRQWFEVLAQGA
jgi:midasin